MLILCTYVLSYHWAGVDEGATIFVLFVIFLGILTYGLHEMVNYSLVKVWQWELAETITTVSMDAASIILFFSVEEENFSVEEENCNRNIIRIQVWYSYAEANIIVVWCWKVEGHVSWEIIWMHSCNILISKLSPLAIKLKTGQLFPG